MAELLFFRRSELLMCVRIEGRLVVGSGSDADILVPDPAVAPRQCAIESRAGRWWLTDLSGQGTDVRAQRVTEAELGDGMDLQLGPWRAVFHPESSVRPEAQEHNTATQRRSPARVRGDSLRLEVCFRGDRKVVPWKEEVVLGTGPDASIPLDDPFVSASHLRLRRTPTGVLVCDLSSRNGTFSGVTRIYEAEVALGTSLKLGETEVTVLPEAEDDAQSVFEGMVGNSGVMRNLQREIVLCGRSPAPVAVFGESGTGKELVAQAIHRRSLRAGGPFVTRNCSALSPTLAESELFGHEKGAFTGADHQHPGAFEQAHGGTLFLDEVGELSLELQAKLLRAVEYGDVVRVGGREPVKVDTRLVVATNRDLAEMVSRRAFREDLYYRLCVLRLTLAPLRARGEDLRELVRHFFELHKPPGMEVALSPEAEAALLAHPWPGNIRELRNLMHASMLRRERSAVLDAADLQFQPMVVRPPEPKGQPRAEDDLEWVCIKGKSMSAIDDEVFLKAWKAAEGRPGKVGQMLMLSKSAVYSRMNKLKLQGPREGSPT